TQPLSFITGNLPAGLSFNASTAVISGTPLNADTYQVSLTASNAFGQDTQTLIIIVTEPVAPPVITSVLTKKTTVNEAFLYTITASGSGPITYGASNLPAGLTVDASTGQISGNPGAAGVYTIGLTATNAGGTTTENLVLTVGTPPAITNVLTASGTAGD
ncbi:putative Ig domain-containing protein, partial [Arthrospira platensis SPKY1]|nr:putative Ig domain-containing protein [Arthrospira platensis SPKY1]